MAAAAADPAIDGRAVYLRHCARCHQTDGRGVEALYPPLRDLPMQGERRRDAIRGVLSGRVGRVTESGAEHDNVMPAHGYLGNEIIAAALSYVVIAWGEIGAPVSAEEVAEQRLALMSDHPMGADAVVGPSPLEDMTAAEYLTSDGPPLTVDEFDRARRLYYGRCTGCHGVLREGTAGNPLTPELMRERGTEYLQTVIAFGARSGMPAWGAGNELSPEDIALLARFLQHPVPQPPDMDAYQLRDGWRQYRIPGERPATPPHDQAIDTLFAVTLHDVGEIALIDGTDKRLIARVAVGRAPHRIAASASGRYLYVLGRDGTVSLIDLYAAPPERVASVRIGYEARAIAASNGPGYEDAYLLAGAYWPPQLVLLDGRTLEPLRQISTRGRTVDGRYHPEPRVSDIAASTRRAEFISNVKETGHTLLVPYDVTEPLHDLAAAAELRAGSFSSDGRFYLTPTDGDVVSVLDVQERRIAAAIDAPVAGGNAGTSYLHERHGPVWVTSTMTGDELLAVGCDPEGHPDTAWRVLERVPAPATGSLFVASHPASPHLWVDTPLNADPAHSQSVAVFDRSALEQGFRTLPVARWSGLASGPRRVAQPTFSPDGREVWMLVWNPQDQQSAVVVVDDATLEPVATLGRGELITPTRLYSIAALRARATAAPNH